MRSIVHAPLPHSDASSDPFTSPIDTRITLLTLSAPWLYTATMQRQTAARTRHTLPPDVSVAQRRPLWRVLWRALNNQTFMRACDVHSTNATPPLTDRRSVCTFEGLVDLPAHVRLAYWPAVNRHVTVQRQHTHNHTHTQSYKDTDTADHA